MVFGDLFRKKETRFIVATTVGVAALCGAVLAIIALFSRRVDVVRGMAKLQAPLALSATKRDNSYADAHVSLGNMRIARRPKSWQVRETNNRIRADSGVGEWVRLEIIHNGATSPITCTVHPPATQIDDKEVQRAMNFVFASKKAGITVERFRKKYPSDKDVAVACTRLPPGDPGEEGTVFGLYSQERCVLAMICNMHLGSRVPIRLPSEDFDIFLVSGVVMIGQTAYCKLWVFPKDSQQGTLLRFVGSEGNELSPSSTERALVEFAVRFAGCLQPGAK